MIKVEIVRISERHDSDVPSTYYDVYVRVGSVTGTVSLEADGQALAGQGSKSDWASASLVALNNDVFAAVHAAAAEAVRQR